MDTLVYPQQEVRPNYLHWSVRALISVIVAHLIIVERQPKAVWTIVHQLNYWVAMAFSVAVCIALVFLIHFFTRRLDEKMPWMAVPLKRGILQFLLGVCLILFLDVMLVKGYFFAFDNDFHKSGYMRIEFPVVRWMVITMNVLYIAWFFVQNYIQSVRANNELTLRLRDLSGSNQNMPGYPRAMEVKLGSKIVIVQLREVVCFEREENTGYVWLRDGRCFNMDYKMQELVKLLDPGQFFQINRSVMFSIASITGYEKVKNLQAIVLLSPGVEVPVSRLVSRHRFDGFKKCMERAKISPSP